ncbi:MAG: ABC transporter, permease protein (cluster 13, osmolytes), partial [uncultured Acidimicrobiales bacterium]
AMGLGTGSRRRHSRRHPPACGAHTARRGAGARPVLSARPRRPALATLGRADPRAHRRPVHHPFPRAVRPARPVHRAVADDSGDRPGQLHAADPGPEHRRRPRRCPRRRPGGGPRHGLPAARPAHAGRASPCRAGDRGRDPHRHRHHHRAGDGDRPHRPGRARCLHHRGHQPGLPHPPGGRLGLLRRPGRGGRRGPGRRRPPSGAVVPPV